MGWKIPYLSFEKLSRMNTRQLENLTAQASSPRLQDLAGRQFQGIFMGRWTRRPGGRSFRRALPAADGADFFYGYDWQTGYSSAVTAPCAASRSFVLRQSAAAGQDSLTLRFLNKESAGRFSAFLQRQEVLRFPDPENPHLLIGQVHLLIGSRRVLIGHTVLQLVHRETPAATSRTPQLSPGRETSPRR